MGRIKKTENIPPVNWEEAKKNNHMREYLYIVKRRAWDVVSEKLSALYQGTNDRSFLAARGYRKSSKLGPTMKARKMEQERNEGRVKKKCLVLGTKMKQ